MLLIILLLITEILTPLALKQHLSSDHRKIFRLSVIFNTILSIWIWMFLFETLTDKGFFDSPRHVWLIMSLTGMISAVLFPRVVFIAFHFTGTLIRIKRGGYIRWLTNTGLAISLLIFSVISAGTFHGRFNFRTENIELKIKGLNKNLDGLRIVQLSDMHLSAFFKHGKVLQQVITEVNDLKPDLILNTGDFVTFGWREFDSSDTILSKAKSRFGNYAVMGNHDFGTYHPFYTEADKADNVLLLKSLIERSGYKVLADTNTIVDINGTKVGIIGIITMGSHPHIYHGDVIKALQGLGSTDFTILLSHDPNQWESDVAGKTGINLTLSGHTHGMQMGIYTKKFRWSPAKYFYPHWGGVYTRENQYQYVNRGLGVLAIPFRIWMPPEITIITLKTD